MRAVVDTYDFRRFWAAGRSAVCWPTSGYHSDNRDQYPRDLRICHVLLFFNAIIPRGQMETVQGILPCTSCELKLLSQFIRTIVYSNQ
jgi:hypothetical protein